MPHPALIPVLIGVAAITAGGVVLRNRAKNKFGKAAPLNAREQAAVGRPLPPAAAQALDTRGGNPSPAALNNLKIILDAGTLTVNDVLKGTDGTIFTKQSPEAQGGLSDDDGRQIERTNMLTVDAGKAGITTVTGNVLFQAVSAADMATRTVLAVPRDPRMPDGLQPVAVPFRAITGIGAAP